MAPKAKKEGEGWGGHGGIRGLGGVVLRHPPGCGLYAGEPGWAVREGCKVVLGSGHVEGMGEACTGEHGVVV